MKKIIVLSVLALTSLMTLIAKAQAQSARDYFNELYKAGGLDKTADEYACFDDKSDHTAFFIYADYSNLKQRLTESGEFAKLPKGQRDAVSKVFLIVRAYDRGVPHAAEDVYYKDGDTWITEPFTVNGEKTPMRMRLTIVDETLRYQQRVEVLNSASKVIYQKFAFGRCELVPH